MKASNKLTRLRVILVLLLLFPISIYAQRVNEHGLKMVSEVELYNLPNGVDCNLKFEYNSKGNLIGIKCYGYNHKTEKHGLMNEYQLRNGLLLFKDYEEDGNHYKHDFEFDWNNNITRITVIPTAGQDVGSKWEWSYSYDLNPLTHSYHLCKEVMREWNTNTQTKTFVSTYERCREYELRDGCVVSEGSKVLIDKSRVNDTNLSLLSFFENGIGVSGSLLNYIDLTEWMGCHNRYMPITNDSKYYRYEYIYDEKGNMSEVFLYEWGKWKKLNGEFGWGIQRNELI